MNWREEALEKLRGYERMRAAERNLKLELRRLKLEQSNIAAARTDAVAVRQSGSRNEDRLLGNLQRCQELEAALERTRCWIHATDGAMAVLEKEEQLILRWMYVQRGCGTIPRLCSQLGVEKSSVYRKRDKALGKFTTALFGATESTERTGA